MSSTLKKKDTIISKLKQASLTRDYQINDVTIYKANSFNCVENNFTVNQFRFDLIDLCLTPLLALLCGQCLLLRREPTTFGRYVL